MLKSEIMTRYGHEMFEWIMQKNPNFIENEDGTKRDYGPFGGWQTWSGALLRNDDDSDYRMVWVPFWGDRDEPGVVHDLFEKFYNATLSNGSKAKYGGFISNLTFEKLYDIDENGNQVEIGEVLTTFDFDEDTYNEYVGTLPSRVPQIIESLCVNSDENAEKLANEGTVSSSTQATFSALDGTTQNEIPAFAYNTKNRSALESAVIRVTNGAKSASVQFNEDTMPVRLSREEILRLYLEMEMYLVTVNAKNTAYKAMVNAHKNDVKSQADYLESHYADPNMELEPEYQEMFNNLVETESQDLYDMAENWGLND